VPSCPDDSARAGKADVIGRTVLRRRCASLAQFRFGLALDIVQARQLAWRA